MLRHCQILQDNGRIRRLDVQPLVHFFDVRLHGVRAPAGVAGEVGNVLPVRAVWQDPDQGVVADALVVHDNGSFRRLLIFVDEEKTAQL